MPTGGAKSERENSPFRVEFVDETGSTNDDVLERARSGEPEGLVLVAGVQHAGRGRRGRRWEAPAGSALLCSWLFRPPPTVPLASVTALVGVSAVEACRSAGAAGVGLKWPNDLVAAEGKMAGMLSESLIQGSDVAAIVVGIGLNLVDASLSPEVASSATSLAAAGGRADRRQLVDALVGQVADRYARLLGGGLVELRELWLRRLVTIGRQVRIELDDETFEGRAVGIDDDYALLVETEGRTRQVMVADVVHLRPTE